MSMENCMPSTRCAIVVEVKIGFPISEYNISGSRYWQAAQQTKGHAQGGVTQQTLHRVSPA
jgi:hypothetical protein